MSQLFPESHNLKPPCPTSIHATAISTARENYARGFDLHYRGSALWMVLTTVCYEGRWPFEAPLGYSAFWDEVINATFLLQAPTKQMYCTL